MNIYDILVKICIIWNYDWIPNEYPLPISDMFNSQRVFDIFADQISTLEQSAAEKVKAT